VIGSLLAWQRRRPQPPIACAGRAPARPLVAVSTKFVVPYTREPMEVSQSRTGGDRPTDRRVGGERSGVPVTVRDAIPMPHELIVGRSCGRALGNPS
jgi:hypothetical protein